MLCYLHLNISGLEVDLHSYTYTRPIYNRVSIFLSGYVTCWTHASPTEDDILVTRPNTRHLCSYSVTSWPVVVKTLLLSVLTQAFIMPVAELWCAQSLHLGDKETGDRSVLILYSAGTNEWTHPMLVTNYMYLHNCIIHNFNHIPRLLFAYS